MAAKEYEIVSGDRRFQVLANEVSDAINRALSAGMGHDECCSVVVRVAADYARGVYGPEFLPGLAQVVMSAAKMKMPADISRN